jgi:hypothetical protein
MGHRNSSCDPHLSLKSEAACRTRGTRGVQSGSWHLPMRQQSKLRLVLRRDLHTTFESPAIVAPDTDQSLDL